MTKPKAPKAEKVAAVESLSTVKSSEEALSKGGKMDIRNREDIDRSESADRYYRELNSVNEQISRLAAKKRYLLQSIMAFNKGLPMPDKEIMRSKTAPEEKKAPKKEAPKKEEKSADRTPEADSSKRGGSEDAAGDVPKSDS
jgi:hypothetical protein